MNVHLTVACLAACSAIASGAISFQNVTSASGISYTQHTIDDEALIVIYLSGGAAAGDFDNDGWPDLYVTRMEDTNILYRNKGDGTFEDVTVSAFGANHLSTSRSNGCGFADLDNDGDLDLYVLSMFSTRYHLFINQGDGTFTEEGFLRGASVFSTDTHYGFNVGFGDYDLDGYLDFHVTEWRLPASLNPTGAPHNNRLLRNLGSTSPAHFTDVTNAAGVATDNVQASILGADSQGFSPRFSDIDQDGWPDLVLTGDHGTSRLFWNDGDGTFTDGTVAANVGTDQFGMGSTLGDYDMDGDLDWFVSSIHEAGDPGRNGNRLFRYDGSRSFTDVTDTAGVREGGWGWGSSFTDFDHDRDLDLIQTNGAYFWFNEAATAGYEDDRTRMFENNGSGVFTDIGGISSGITDTGRGKGLLTFDYDRDGDLDVFIVNNQSGPVLYENTGADGANWLIIRPVGTKSNRQGLGTRITVIPEEGDTPLIREVNAGTNYLGQDEVLAHYGLGTMSGTTVHSVVLKWPTGVIQTLSDVPINQDYYVTEPLGIEPSIPVSVTRLANGDLEFEWPSEVGKTYLLETCGNPAIPHWNPYHQLDATGLNSSCVLPQSEVIGAGKYFRVVKLED